MNEQVTQAGLDKILQTPIEGITKTFIESLFANYHDKTSNEFKEAPFKTTDKIELTSAQYKWVQDKVSTTLGMLIFNRYCLERTGIIDHLGYWNTTIDAKGMKKVNTAVNNLCIENKIDTKVLGEFIDSRDRLGFWCASFLSVAISPSLLRPMDDVNKRKKELFEQYRDKLENGTAVEQVMIANKIEKELMGMVRENLKGDYGYDLYASGDGNLDNNYKTINVMRGSVFNDITKKYDVVESSLMDGITQKDIPAFGNSVVSAAYPSAVGTAEAGYMSKQLLAVLQSEKLDPDPESDCGTNSTIPFTVLESAKNYILYRYINDNGKKVLLDLNNIDKYVGQKVQLYSPQCCTHDAICGKCGGRLFHNLGATQIGLLSSVITQKLLNIKLKSKHDLSQNAGTLKKEQIFKDINSYFEITPEGMLKNKLAMRIYIPKVLENMSGFVKETTLITTMGIAPVEFLGNNQQVMLSTIMIVPVMLDFNLYDEPQETVDNYIITYQPGSEICSLNIQQSSVNVEAFLNQVYLDSSKPQVPYNMLTDLMFRCLDMNKTDLTGPSIVYELLARRLCKGEGRYSFAKVYGKDPLVDPMSYRKVNFRTCVQESGVSASIFFQDLSKSINIGLQQTLNGEKSEETPLEMIINA